MRIAWVVPGGVDRSGQERVIPVLLALMERLAQRHSLHVFALRQYPEPCVYPLRGATVHNLGWTSPGPGPRAWRILRPWLRERSFLAELRAAGPFQVVHGFWGGGPGFWATLAGRCLRLPSVVSLAGGELVGLPEIGYGAQLHWGSRWQVQLSLRWATRLTVASGYMQALLERHGYTADEIPWGVAPDWLKAEAPAPQGPPWRLLHVASLNPVKDQATLLRALQKVVASEPQVHLDIVGEDTLDGAVHTLCTELGLEDHVTFHGYLPHEILKPLYQQAHLLVLPSRHDAAPIVVLEAAACRVPTVGTRVGYVADWAPVRAWAVPVGDSDGMAQGIRTLLYHPSQRQQMGQAARAWVEQHDADWTRQQFERIYQQLAEKGI